MLREMGPMEKKRKPRGRPRKKEGTIEFWQFVRAAATMSAYDEARESGQKHSVAVTQAVDSIRRLQPTMPISRTVVKRILAEFRPRSGGTILRFERTTLSEEAVEKLRWIWAQLADLQGRKGLTLPSLPNDSPPKFGTTFKIRFAERPTYPRHNRKTQE
jgi:hypothetical protein